MCFKKFTPGCHVELTLSSLAEEAHEKRSYIFKSPDSQTKSIGLSISCNSLQCNLVIIVKSDDSFGIKARTIRENKMYSTASTFGREDSKRNKSFRTANKTPQSSNPIDPVLVLKLISF